MRTQYARSLQRRRPAVDPPLLEIRDLAHVLEMAHVLDIRLAPARAPPARGRDVDATAILGHLVLVRRLVPAHGPSPSPPTPRKGVVLAHPGDVARKGGGRSGCDRIGAKTM